MEADNVAENRQTSSKDIDLIRCLLSENPSLNEVLSLIGELLERITGLESEVEALRKENVMLKKENLELKRRLGLDSSNSSKPPSSDLPSAKYPTRTPTGRKPGKQEGAKGHRRHFLPATIIVDHRPDICQHCGATIGDGVPATGACQRRQQVEIPPIEPVVTERRYHGVRCPDCGKVARAKPREGEKKCYGPRLGALIAILATSHNLTRRHIKGLLGSVLGTQLSLGTIDNCIREVGHSVQNPVAALGEELAQQTGLNIDETGWKKDGERRWLWTFVAPTLTFFHIAESRGKKVLEQILGERFDGIIGSDRYGVYRSYDKAGWQVCLAHLIREAKGLSQSSDPAASRFGTWVRGELRVMIKLWKEGKTKSRQMNSCKARLKRACYLQHDSPDKHARRFANAILKDWDAVTLFTKVGGVLPTNNLAEQSLRQSVIARKISYGNHSETGLRTTERLRTILATAKIRGIDAWTYLTHALGQYRIGQPVPLLQASPTW